MKLKEVKKDNAFKNLLKACLDLVDMADDNKIIYKAYNRAYNICKQVGYPNRSSL